MRRMKKAPSGVWTTDFEPSWMERNYLFYLAGSYLLWARNIVKAFRKV